MTEPLDGSEWLRPKGDQYAQWLAERGRAGIMEHEPPMIDKRGSYGSHYEEPLREDISGVMVPSKHGHNGEVWENRLKAYYLKYGKTWFRIEFPNWDFVPKIEGDFGKYGIIVTKPFKAGGITFRPKWRWSGDYKAHAIRDWKRLFSPMPENTRWMGPLFP